MLGLSEHSHISSYGSSRLNEAFNELIKDLSVQDKKFNSYYGINSNSKRTWWSAWLYSRNSMVEKEDTKRKLIDKVKNDASIGSSDSTFNALFVDCTLEIEKYLNKRDSFYLRISKDRILFLKNLQDLIKLLVGDKDDDRKIKNLAILIKNLSEIIRKKIWTGMDWGHTSINHVLEKICHDMSYGVAVLVVRNKTKMSAVILDDLSNEIDSFLILLRSAINNLVDLKTKKHDEQQNSMRFCDQIDKIKDNFDCIKLYKISRNEYYHAKKITTPNKIFKNDRVYLKLELSNTKNKRNKLIYLKTDVEGIDVNKKVADMNISEKVLINYKGEMLVNFVIARLWCIKHATFLKNICDQALENAIKEKTITKNENNVYQLFFKEQKDFMNEEKRMEIQNSSPTPLRRSSAPQLVSLKQTVSRNSSGEYWNNDLSNPFSDAYRNKNTPCKSSFAEPDFSSSSKKFEKKYERSFLDKLLNRNKTSIGGSPKTRDVKAQVQPSRDLNSVLPTTVDHRNKLDILGFTIETEPFIEVNSYVNYENKETKFNYNFTYEGGNLGKIMEFKSWSESLLKYKNEVIILFNDNKVIKNSKNIDKYYNVNNKIKTNIDNLDKQVKLFVKSLKKSNFKAIARYQFIPLSNNKTNNYFTWVKSVAKSNTTKGMWDFLVNDTTFKKEIKDELMRI